MFLQVHVAAGLFGAQRVNLRNKYDYPLLELTDAALMQASRRSQDLLGSGQNRGHSDGQCQAREAFPKRRRSVVRQLSRTAPDFGHSLVDAVGFSNVSLAKPRAVSQGQPAAVRPNSVEMCASIDTEKRI